MWPYLFSYLCAFLMGFVSVGAFFIRARRGKHFLSVVIICAISILFFLFGVAVLCAYIEPSARAVVEPLFYAIVLLTPLLYYFLAFDASLSAKVFYSIIGLVIIAVISSLSSIIEYLFLLGDIHFSEVARILVRLFLAILISGANALIFRKITNVYTAEKPDIALLIFSIGDGVILGIVSVLAEYIGNDFLWIKICLHFANVLIGFLLIYAQYLVLAKHGEEKEVARLQMETEMLSRLQYERLRQFDTFKSTIDLINLKYHDLKHRFGGGIVDPRIEEELSSGIEAYDVFCHTNNENLDVILTQLGLEGQSKGIDLEVVADASCLSFLSIGELYSLFGNAVDNAFRYLSTLEEKEKRFVRVKVKTRMRLCLIVIENYFEGDPKEKIEAGKEHGYGLKSIAAIAEKYDGSLSIKKENGLFTVSIILTKPH